MPPVPPPTCMRLGAILYECLTGGRRSRGRRRTETLEQVRSQEPVPAVLA